MNIQTSLQELYETGLTDKEIGRRIDASQSIVFRLRTGVHRTTEFERGQKILQLYQEVMSGQDIEACGVPERVQTNVNPVS